MYQHQVWTATVPTVSWESPPQLNAGVRRPEAFCRAEESRRLLSDKAGKFSAITRSRPGRRSARCGELVLVRTGAVVILSLPPLSCARRAQERDNRRASGGSRTQAAVLEPAAIRGAEIAAAADRAICSTAHRRATALPRGEWARSLATGPCSLITNVAA